MNHKNIENETLLSKLGIDRSLVSLIVIIVLIRTMIIGHFVIPSGSMLPTLKLGDHVIVNELAYGLHLPLMKRNLFNWSEPSRGDIIVFPHPTEGTTLIKRVVGVAGDTISFDEGKLVINGKPVDETSISSNEAVLKDLGENINSSKLYKETLPNNIEHWILRSPFGFTVQDTRHWQVPKGHVFVSGDNRDNSVDSRFWGYVDVEAIYGPALFISYSTIPDSGFPPQFRKERFFSKLDNNVSSNQ